MPRPLRHGFLYSALVFLLAFPAAPAGAQEGPLPTLPDEIPLTAGKLADGRLQLLIELPHTPAGVVYGSILQAGQGGHDRALAAAKAAAQSQMRTIGAAQEKVAVSLKALNAAEIYRVGRAYNGIAIAIDPAKVALLRRLPGIKAIHPLVPEYPTNSTSVPFIGVPPLWNNSVGLGTNLTGTGIRIGIIDTGIDYIHANFGGSGLLADYQANNTTSNADGFFPTAKVVGGTDFAGDAYDGTTMPTPDPDPMDCNGHGSHVAGTAAGFGVDAAGATFTGPYSPAAPFGALRIGPGVAPGASLYALRIFGCGGSTGLTIQAIDWAIDPNGDGDFSDHLDVINMSLGSNYGGASATSAVASENAAIAGVIVVAAAGNAGDTFYIVSAPSAANRALSVAASADSGLASAVLQVNSPAGIAGNYAALAAAFVPAPPNPAGQTATIVQALDAANAAGPLTTDGCTAFTNAAAVAGNIALIDRGTCGFIVKVQNAQAAGAIGAIVANNVTGDPNLTLMGGTAPPGPAVTIPSVFISLADATTIRSQLPGVNGTLAAATQADTIGSFTSRGSRLGAPFHLKPDITAPGVTITSTQTGNTCVSGGCLVPNASGFIPGSQSLILSGTSMATPHIAGVMALLRQLHPDWTVEELKAAAMNGALHDITIGANGAGVKYDAGRIGAGRTDPQNSALTNVVAFDADQSGVVSVTFDAPIVGPSATQVKHVRVVNHGATAATFDLAIDLHDDAPGIAFSLPGGSTVTVPAGQTVDVDVQMNGNANQMRHVPQVTLAPTQAAPAPLTSLGNLARHWDTQEEGYLTFSQSGTAKLRVPVYMAARPASAMAAAGPIVTGGANTGATNLLLNGTDVCTGTLGAGPICTATTAAPTYDEVSLVSPFELQAVSGLDPVNAPASADIQYAGVAYDPATNLILFGVSTWGGWTTPNEVSFNIYIDNNSDGTYDRILFNTDPGTAGSALFGGTSTGQDSFLTLIFNLATSGVGTGTFINRLSSASIDSAVFNNNVMILAATPAQLGLPAGTTNFKWKIQTCPGFAPLCGPVNGFFYDEAAGPFSWNYAAASQGLNFGGKSLVQDLNGASLPVTWNLANLAANGSQGALLLHHHNAAGNRAQVVLVQGTPSADLAISKSMAPPNPTIGQNVTFTLTVTNAGPGAATGVVVSDALPTGITYVSDDGGGAYDSTTGLWTVGSVAVSGSASLHIVATIQTTDPVDNVAQIVASTPLDTNPANNQSTVTVLAPRAADLGLTASVSSPTVLVGNPVTYTFTVTNTGDDPAYSVNVQEAFPAYPLLNPTSFTASQGVYNSGTGVWDLASLGKGASATLTITLNAPNIAGPLTSQGTAGATTSDPNNANNTASATTTVLSPAAVSGAKTVAGTFTEGGTVTYTVVLSNSGSNTQQDNPGNEFTDVLPSQLTLVSATATAGTPAANVLTNTVTWNGSIAAAASVTITITATIKAGSFGQTISNQGTISYDADGNGTNEASALTDDPGKGGTADTTSFLVLSPAAVSGTKTVSGTFAEGSAITYTVVLHNSGAFPQQDNPGDEFTDVLPASLLLTGATATSGTATTDAANTVHWNGSIAAGSSVTITITAVITTGAAGTSISNQGTIHFDADGNQTNESTVETDDPAVAGASDPTTFQVLSVAEIPTLSEVGLATLALLLAAGAFVALRKRRTV
jgi:uncharacterized repeat protein (TIGR01451 family)